MAAYESASLLSRSCSRRRHFRGDVLSTRYTRERTNHVRFCPPLLARRALSCAVRGKNHVAFRLSSVAFAVPSAGYVDAQ